MSQTRLRSVKPYMDAQEFSIDHLHRLLKLLVPRKGFPNLPYYTVRLSLQLLRYKPITDSILETIEVFGKNIVSV